MEGFLSLVVPDPLEQYFSRFFNDGGFFRRAMFVYGQPGSGKTTLARLFEAAALSTLLNNDSGDAFCHIRDAVERTGAIENGLISILGARIPLESDFRELANLPYSVEIRRQLFLRLIQARTVLRWFSQLVQIDIEPQDVTLATREGFESRLDVIGGSNGASLLARARLVEGAIYSLLGALIPPKEVDFPDALQLPYQIFDVLAEFRVPSELARDRKLSSRLRPFVILDDAHSLSSEQFNTLRQWSTRREIVLGRWVLSRLDALSPSEIATEFASSQTDGLPGQSSQRDYEIVFFQGVGTSRAEARRKFRKVAEAISSRYMKQVEPLSRRQIADLSSILDCKVSAVPEEELAVWRDEIEAEMENRQISTKQRELLEQTVDSILKNKGASSDLRCALLRILVHRRSTVRQLTLFDLEEPEATVPKVDSSLIGGAEIHLFRSFGRPFFFGFEQLVLASSENPELFVGLAGKLVDASLSRLLRRQRPSLPADEQNRLLRDKASQIFHQWNFPEASAVRLLVDGIAARCGKATDMPNAYLKSGANAFGFPMGEFETLKDSDSPLANAIKYGVAYSVFSISLDRSVKNKQWCLVTLGGVACMHHRLTLALGGFVEGTVSELEKMLTI